MTPEGARAFVAAVEKDLYDFSLISSRAAWVNATYINDDSDAVAAYFGTIGTEKGVKYATEAAKYARIQGLDFDTARKLDLMRGALTLAAPTTPGAATQLNELATRLQSAYAKGRAQHKGKAITGDVAEELMGTLRDPKETAEVWRSWHETTGRPMRQDYARMVEIANAGAKELGYADTGAMWRSQYDMTPQEFVAMYDRLLGELDPLYKQLHCYTRAKLNQKYGNAVQPATGPIRADLLGNMWAQEWGNIYDIVAPKGAGDIGYDIGELLEAKKKDPVEMVKIGEGFYSSLGLAALPETFWQRSQIVRPRDREVVCHASAWDVDNKDDLRIKMCTKVNSDDFVTIHHELGHNYYQRAYNQQSYLYLNGANGGFHEAIGDFIALSITPEYLVQIGLLDREGPVARQGYGAAAAPGDGQGRLHAVQLSGRQMALGRVRRFDHTGQLQPGLGRPEAALPGDRTAGSAVGSGLRSGRQVPHPGQHQLRALFHRPRASVPILQGGLRHVRLEGTAAPLQLLRQQGSRRASQPDVEHGRVKALARCAAGLHRHS